MSGLSKSIKPATESWANAPDHHNAELCFSISAPNGEPDANITNNSRCVTIDNITSTSELSSADDIRVYPNPAARSVHITRADAVGHPVSTHLVNASGQIVFSHQLTASTSIDVSQYAPGLYYVVLGQGATTTVRKVIITSSD